MLREPVAIDHHAELAVKLTTRTARVAVVGLGYVGLSLAAALGRAGFTVRGIDVDLERVSLARAGISYISDVPTAVLTDLVADGRFDASTGFDDVDTDDVVIIGVPTPLGKSREPDISFIVSAMDSLEPRLRRGQLLILESTTYPGTTEEVLRPRVAARGFTVGEDFFLAFSPERVDPGNHVFTTGNIPKVVGGLTARCTALAAMLYRTITSHVHCVAGPRVAETAKLVENTFRSVNIALANELALACRAMGVDPWEVIDAAATKPFGFMPFYPGPGIGGHCIPLDPLYLSWRARRHGFEPRFIALADEVNRAMPQHVVSLAAEALDERGRCLRGARVLVLGVTYKRDVNDVRESPALDVMRLLARRGALVEYSDPHVPQLMLDDAKLTAVDLTTDTLASADCVLVVSDHSGVDYERVARHARLVVDTRNALRAVPDGAADIVRL